MAKPKTAAPALKSKKSGIVDVEPGKGSTRVDNYFIVLYAEPKARKTTTCSTVEGAKWLISDSNCIATLRALDRLPPDEDLYEAGSLGEAREILSKFIKAGEEGKLKGLPAFILDSITQFVDWHQQDVAAATQQRFMGDNAKNNGWQQFNAEFGAFLDDLAILSRYCTVIVIAHSKEKVDITKGTWSGVNLPPAMALKLSRLANWILFQNLRTFAPDASTKEDDFISIREIRGEKRATEVVVYTQPVGTWMATCNSKNLDPEEPADMAKILAKEGIL